MKQFDSCFFEGEYRDGFFVEEKMKRAWAAQIEILLEIDRICRKHEIQYFADSGTLLGAVRHKGFIPWDDDIDIAMKREDYNKFLKVAAFELPKEWRLVNAYTTLKWDQAFSRVKNGKNYNLNKGHLEKFHGCPYIVGVDIFPLDYIPREKEEEDILYLILQHCYGVVWKIKQGKTDEVEQPLQEIEEMCNVTIDRDGNIVNQLILLMDKLSSLYSKEEADELALLMFRPDAEKKYTYKKEWLDTCIELPFENIMVPAPVGYEGVLESLYGDDYMIPQQIAACHDYPFYKKQESELEQFKKSVVFIVSYDDERYLEECLYYIKKLHVPLGMKVDVVSVSGTTSPVEDYNSIIEECNARYKVYLDQRTFIINDMFLYEVLSLFRGNPQIGMLGVLGGDTPDDLNKGRILVWDENGIADNNYQSSKETEGVAVVNGMLMVTQYDIPWTEDEIRQAAVFKENGYEVVIPYQSAGWCLYDCRGKVTDPAWEDYYFYLRRVEVYHDKECAAAVERLLMEGILDYREHIQQVEKQKMPGSITPYFWEDFLLANSKREKYLQADGEVALAEKKKMHIVVSFNHKYAMYASVMLQSLYENNPLCNICVHVLQQELTSEDRAALEKQAESFGNEIQFYDFKRELLPSDLHVTKEWSLEAYFRLFMVDLLPADVDRVLYLDVDVIVNKPVYDFYFMDMQAYDIVACRDFSMVLKEEFTDKRKDLFGAVSAQKDFVYFNSGVMLINISALRGKMKGADYLKVIEDQKDRLLAPDQDVINLVHWNKTGLVDEWRYDFFSACIKGVQDGEVKQYVSIIHYAGPKPWSSGNVNLHAHSIWWEYAARTDMALEFVYGGKA